MLYAVGVFSKFLEGLKSPRQTAIAFVTSLALLVVLARTESSLRLQSLDRYGGSVLFIALFTGWVLVVGSIYSVARLIQKKRGNKADKERREGYVNTLSTEEKSILLTYLIFAIETQYLYANDDNVGSLTRKGIIYQASRREQAADSGLRSAYKLEPWAKEYIVEHPYVLDNAQAGINPPFPLDWKPRF